MPEALYVPHNKRVYWHSDICTRMTCGPSSNAMRFPNIRNSHFVFFTASLFIPPDLGSHISDSAVTSPMLGKVERASVSNLQYIVYYESLVRSRCAGWGKG